MKFIHLADVHLGAVPDKGCPWSGRREEEIWKTFRRVIASIRENPVDLLFIAGDLFHRQPQLQELEQVNELFQSIPRTRVYLCAGDHDYIRKHSNYRTFSWAKNVTFFSEEEVGYVKDSELPVYVYSFSYHHPELKFSVLQGCQPEAGEGIHILMAHGGDEEHSPIDTQALFRAGFDYIALGHLHTPALQIREHSAYAGSLEPLRKEEMGAHGYMAGSIEEGRLHVEFVPFASRTYEQMMLTVTPETTQKELEQQMKNYVREHGEENLYTVILEGKCAPEVLLIPEKLKKLANVRELVDETYPEYDLEQLLGRYRNTLIGDYLEYFAGRELTHAEEKALYYGLQALLETSR